MSLRRVTIPVPSRRQLAGALRGRPYREYRHRRHAGEGAPWATRDLRHAVVALAFVGLAHVSAAGWLSVVATGLGVVYAAVYGFRWWWALQLDLTHAAAMLRRLRAVRGAS